LLLVLFVVFFLLKDGDRMWGWALGWASVRRRADVDGAGRAAWDTLPGYVHASLIVGLVDALGIGAALLIPGVSLWFSLTLLMFLGRSCPRIGATVSGAVAVLVTMVTDDVGDAVIVLVVVLVVQQVEGNLLQPLIMSRPVALHPVAILAAVTAGGLLLGIAGALLAVPLVAVVYRVLTWEPAGGAVDDARPASSTFPTATSSTR
jgi:predicted PurR-regulated permease PerM